MGALWRLARTPTTSAPRLWRGGRRFGPGGGRPPAPAGDAADIGAQVVAGAVLFGPGVAEPDDQQVGRLAGPFALQRLALFGPAGRRLLAARRRALAGLALLGFDRSSGGSADDDRLLRVG